MLESCHFYKHRLRSTKGVHIYCIVSNQIMKVLHCTLFERHVLRFALTVFVVAVLILVVIIVIGVCLDLDALRGN